MSIIDELLEEYKESDLDVQVHALCEEIFEEEKDNINHMEDLPEGSNIFLALEVPPINKKEVNFITLERDEPNKYFVGIWRLDSKGHNTIRFKSIDITHDKPKLILREFALQLNYLKGK